MNGSEERLRNVVELTELVIKNKIDGDLIEIDYTGIYWKSVKGL